MRDGRMCVAPSLDRGGSGPCWGELTLDHIKDDPRLSQKAPDDEEHLVTICDGHSERGARAGYQWNTAHRPLLRGYLWRYYKRDCQFHDCEQKAVGHLEVDLGPDFDPRTKLADAVRRHTMRLCQPHLDLVGGGVFV